MKECEFEDALTAAEIACRDELGRCLGVPIYRDANPSNPDCGVFNIGYMYTGDHALFGASAYHWRATLELYDRDRTHLQRTIMGLLRDYPVSRDANPDSPLREYSNVLVFRVAPETNGVSAVERTEIASAKDARKIPTYAATVSFDVVFAARF